MTTPVLSNRQRLILNQLQTGNATSSTLAYAIGDIVPTASVRRDIQALRRAGYIINDARDNNGAYRLVGVPA